MSCKPVSLRRLSALTAAAGIIPAIFGGGTALAQSGPDPMWITQFGTPESDIARALAPDAAGGVFIMGDTEGDIAAPNAGLRDIFLTRHDSTGSQIWSRQIGTDANEVGAGAAADDAGGVFITGWTLGDLAGPGSHLGNNDVFLARYDADGTQLWLTQFGTDASDQGRAVVGDGVGGVYITGNTARNLVAGGGPSFGRNDAFLARYDSAGLRHWVVQLGTPEQDRGQAITTDGVGGVYIGIDTEESLGGPHAGDYDVAVARYDANGTQLWIRQFGGTADDLVRAMAPDSAGGVFVAGVTRGDLAGPGSHTGGNDAFLARYDANGNQLWIRQFGTPENQTAHGLLPDGAGGVFITGPSSGELAGPGSHSGSNDTFRAHYDSDGNQVWITQFGTAESDVGRGIASDGAGGIFVAGETGGDLGGPNIGDTDIFLARFPGDAVAPCYANCDGSTNEPILTVDDFTCFINEFAAAQGLPHEEQIEHYANCDGSTQAPVLTVDDFTCFINAFAQGCP